MTRISATGADRRRDHGFTLVELMVVLVIIGMASAAVALTIPEPRLSVEAEAERLAARMKRAQEEAVLANRPVALPLSETGYGFQVRRQGEWVALQERPFETVTWGEGLRVQVFTPGRQPMASGRLRFDVTGGATPARVSLSRDTLQAEVVLDAGGGVRVDVRPS